jgi:ribosomal protein S18 acetylase RimI-like enzyme
MDEMNVAEVVVARAETADIDGIFGLARANSPENGGSLSVRFSREDIATSIHAWPAVVARRNGTVVAFVLTRARQGANPPILEAMFRAYPGAEDAYSYGPVCVDESVRGKGIAMRMFELLRTLLPGREGVLFIRADNEPSLRAHRKMGMREAGEFTFGGARLIVFAYDG